MISKKQISDSSVPDSGPGSAYTADYQDSIFFDRILESIKSQIFSVDLEGRYIAFNQFHATVMQRSFGADIQLGHCWFDYFTVEKNRQIARSNIDRALKGEIVVDLVPVPQLNKTTIYLESTHYPIYDDQHAVIGVTVLAFDVTEKRTAQILISQSEERYRSTLDSMLEGCQIIGHDWRYLYLNDTAVAHSRLKREDLIGNRFTDLWPGVEETELYKKMKDCLENRHPHQMENYFQFSDTSYGWFELSIQPVPEGLFILSVDITARKIAELEVQQLNQELEQRVEHRTVELTAANKELEAFTYSVSHDLRAPLRAIVGFANILQEDYSTKLDEEGRRILNIITSNTEQMGKLIDDLLSFSRLSRSGLRFVKIDMYGLASSVIRELVPVSTHSRIDFSLHPIPIAFGDQSMIRQVWMNLISNAIKFSSLRERTVIEIGYRKEEDDVVYYIKDNGSGFDMKYAGKIFGVFERLHNQKEYEGTGVGLAIAERVITKHGGRIWADSQPDQGATFYFTIPNTKSNG